MLCAGAELGQLSALSKLQHLNLRGVYRMADANLAVGGLTALQSLNLQECWQITAQGLTNLSTLVQLTNLNLQVTTGSAAPCNQLCDHRA